MKNSHIWDMKNILAFFVSALLLFFMACEPAATNTNASAAAAAAQPKPLGTGDAESLALVEKMMEANGGQAAWDNTRYIHWNFFGSRVHTWDKLTNDLVIKGKKDNFDIKMNLTTGKGTVNYAGVDYAQPDTLAKYLQMGREMWNNDSYWLLMPYKLRDAGVNLKYLGQESFRNIPDIHLMEVTFDNVGDTPQNKYIIRVHPKVFRVMQWDFYPTRDAEKPKFSTPWNNYRQYGNIWLSESRGENYVLEDISVDEPGLAEAFK